MVLVDTSVWIDHLRNGNQHLVELLNNTSVACHPFVLGEIACGNIKNREEILGLMQSLSSAPFIDMDEYLKFIDSKELSGRGIGFVDIHLLASSILAGYPLWTGDKKLYSIAVELNAAYKYE